MAESYGRGARAGVRRPGGAVLRGHQTSAAQAQLHALANQLCGEQYATLRASLRALSDASAGLPPQLEQDEAPADEPAPPAE